MYCRTGWQLPIVSMKCALETKHLPLSGWSSLLWAGCGVGRGEEEGDGPSLASTVAGLRACTMMRSLQSESSAGCNRKLEVCMAAASWNNTASWAASASSLARTGCAARILHNMNPKKSALAIFTWTLASMNSAEAVEGTSPCKYLS